MSAHPHTIDNGGGELLTFLGIRSDERGEYLEVRNVVSPGSGPPMHVHRLQEEGLTVERGTMGYQVLGEEERRAAPGESVTFAPGVAHRFWNAGDDELVGTGFVRPPDNLEYFLTEIYASTRRNEREAPRSLRWGLPRHALPQRVRAPGCARAGAARALSADRRRRPAVRPAPALRRRAGAGAAGRSGRFCRLSVVGGVELELEPGEAAAGRHLLAPPAVGHAIDEQKAVAALLPRCDRGAGEPLAPRVEDLDAHAVNRGRDTHLDGLVLARAAVLDRVVHELAEQQGETVADPLRQVRLRRQDRTAGQPRSAFTARDPKGDGLDLH